MSIEQLRYYLIFWQNNSAEREPLALLIERSKEEALGNPVRNNIPPPERDIYVEPIESSLNKVFSEKFEKVIGLIIDDDLCFDGDNMSIKTFRALGSAVKKAKANNPIIGNHGFYLGIFSPGLPLENQVERIDLLENHTLISEEIGLLRAEYIDDAKTMAVFLNGQLRRAAVSEMKLRQESCF